MTQKAPDIAQVREQRFHRDLAIDRSASSAISDDDRTVEVAFSSEEPYERYFGFEILDHSPSAVRLGRLQSGGAVLVDHDTRDHVGVVESVRVDSDRRGRALLRFGRSARAAEILQDVRDGIRSLVSVGYRVHDMVLDRRGAKGEPDSYRVTDWEPFEISLVSVPADPSVGVGRSDTQSSRTQEIHMDTSKIEQPAAQPVAPAVDVREIENKARTAELARIRGIQSIGDHFKLGEKAAKAIEEGTSLDEFRAQAIEHLGRTAKPIDTDVGLTAREAKQFSFVRAIHALANPNDRRAQEAAAFEYECSRAASEQMGKAARGILVPSDVLKRDLSVGTTTAGGHTVATDLLAGSFIDLLRNRSYMMQVATVLSGLNGNVAIPRQTAGATAYWVAEAGAPTESQQAFDQVTLSPKTLGGFTDFGRRLMLQSSLDVEAMVRRDLATVLALEIDRAALHGSGSSNQPTGVAATSGIGSVAGGTNGLAPAWSHIVALETEVAIDNADIGSLMYITNAKVRGKLKGVEKASTTGLFVWESGDTPLNGYRALVTNQVSSTLTKGTSSGVCSAIFFGNWADLLIGMWGGLDLLVDPYTASTTGTVRVTALQDVDVAVRHPESFAAMLDALTT